VPWTHILVHHSGAEEASAAQIRAYHKSLGWRDAGYHYLIERDGRVVNGRPPTMRGAHCVAGNMNRKALGICVIGNLENRPPTPAQREALTALVRRLAAEHRIPAANVLGHGEVPGAATACPGRHMDMPALRRELAGCQHPDDGRPAGRSRVQVGAYTRPEAAAAMAAELEALGYEVWVRRD